MRTPILGDMNKSLVCHAKKKIIPDAFPCLWWRFASVKKVPLLDRVNESYLLHNPWSWTATYMRTTETVEAQADGNDLKIPRTYPQCALISYYGQILSFSGKGHEKRLIWVIGQCVISPHSPHSIGGSYTILTCVWDPNLILYGNNGDAE